jgi:hypothetical protein
MTKAPEGNEKDKDISSGYHRMLERAKATIEGTESTESTEGSGLPRLQELIADARDKAVELGELTREEAERIGDYLRRDVTDAAQYLADSNKALKDWLSFDMELIEDRVLRMFSLMVDHTRLELDRLAMQAKEAESLHTGEVTAMGTLRCSSCGKELHFHGPGHIPPCPGCRGTRFQRVSH